MYLVVIIFWNGDNYDPQIQNICRMSRWVKTSGLWEATFVRVKLFLAVVLSWDLERCEKILRIFANTADNLSSDPST